MKNLVHAANATAWALGVQRRNGFHVRKMVWGLLMARAEKREGEEIRAAVISVESKGKRKTKGMRRLWPRDLTVARVDEHGVAYNAAGESIGITGTMGPVCGHEEPELRFFGEVPL